MERKYLKLGDKIELTNSEIVTVKKLDFDCFTTHELNRYVLKKEIKRIIEPNSKNK